MLYILVVLGLIAISAAVYFMTTLQRCGSNEVLVVSGKLFGVNKGRPVAIYRGGTVNVVPLVQQLQRFSLIPLNIDVRLGDALSFEKIRISIPSNFQIAFSSEIAMLENAATRLAGLSKREIVAFTEDIIMGGMRAVLAGMKIEEINDDREKLMAEIENQIKPELDKLGLVITNVNIQDIDDSAGIIKALGKKAAAAAVNKANVEVAEQQKTGEVGVSRENAERTVQVQEQETRSVTGVAETQKDRTVKVAELQSQTTVEKLEFEQKKLIKEAELEVTRAEANQKKQVAESKARQAALTEEKKQETLRMEKEEIVPREINKRQLILDAEAEAAQITAKAEADANAIKLKYFAEAEGIEKVLNAKAVGYAKMFKDVDAPNLLGMEYMKIAPEMQALVTDAVKGIKINNIDVIDSGNGQATGNFLKGFIGSLPLAHKLAKNVGINLPDFMGTPKTTETITQ